MCGWPDGASVVVPPSTPHIEFPISQSLNRRFVGTIEAMQHWDLHSAPVEARQPEILHSEGEGRTILIALPAGEGLQDHQVHERAWLVVVDGEIEVGNDGETVSGGPGFLAGFDPNQRPGGRAPADARLPPLLAPRAGGGP